MKNLYLIGLTGNIACGKSTVLAMLRERGAHVIDADAVTRELQQPDQPVYQQIVATFGEGILVAPGGPIDRPKLGAIVFSDPAALRTLEQLVHPAVRERIMAWLEEVARQGDKELAFARPGSLSPLLPVSLSRPVAVIDAIKLLEGGWKAVVNAVWVVTCAPEQQLARLMSTRGMRESEARMRIAAQPPQADKVAQADVVIDNSGTLEQTRVQVDAAWQAIVGTEV
jgi:dephospho-CoA kinase